MYMIVPILGSVRFFFLKQINTFIQQGRIKLIKSGSKYIYNVKKKRFLFLKTVLLNFLFIKEY